MTTPNADVLTDYRELAEECVDRLSKQYDFRARWHRRLFRLSGIFIILSGVALSPLAVFNYRGKAIIVALIGVIVGAVTGLRTFYQWDQNWSVLRRTHFDLTQAYNEWRLAFRHAQTGDDPNKVEELAYDATKALLDRVATIRGSESDRFFASLQFPAPDNRQQTKP